jgi:hypothetical protein
MAGTKVKTKVGDLQYVFIKGEGRNQALPGAEVKMMYTASILTDEGSDLHKDFEAQVDAEWDEYKKAKGLKGRPKTNGIKIHMIPDPSGAIDPDTEEVKKIPSGKVRITMKTNVKWPDGKPQVIKLLNNKGKDVTAAFHEADWNVGEGSKGVLHGKAVGNDVGGSHKVTLYLSAVQLATLVKYEGSGVEADDLGGDDMEIGDGFEALDETNTPKM